MKVTTGFFYETFLRDLNRQIEAMYKAQRQLATGKRVLSPGDDPVGITRIIKYKVDLSALNEYKRASNTAKLYNSSIEDNIENLKNIVVKAKQLAVQGSSDTLSPTDRLALAKEVDSLIQRSIETVNTKISERYIFGGYKTDSPPVNPSTGLYESDTNIQYLDISFFLYVEVNLPATEFFTYTATGPNSDLKVLTPYNYNFTGNSNAPYDADPLGALLMPQPSGGAINDPSAVFTTNGGALTIRLGDNQAVTVNISANASLNDIRDAINSQAGSTVKAWVINYGTSASPDYRLVIGSVPNGKSDMIRIDVTTTDASGTGLNLLAYNPESGNVSMSFQENINGYNYITDSNDSNYYSFNNNYLNENYYLRALHFLKVALENNDQGRIQKAVDYFDKIADKLYKQQSIIGARLNKIESISDYNLETETNTNQALSDEQDADALHVISELNQRLTVLQALRVTLTDFFRVTLFDFLR
uniref:Flagellar hook-associated protein 3 n=1 Tax=Thermodesulfovibrio aggregans TaxID=86166 RepID=A0A7C4EMZ4_9BACT